MLYLPKIHSRIDKDHLPLDVDENSPQNIIKISQDQVENEGKEAKSCIKNQVCLVISSSWSRKKPHDREGITGPSSEVLLRECEGCLVIAKAYPTWLSQTRSAIRERKKQTWLTSPPPVPLL